MAHVLGDLRPSDETPAPGWERQFAAQVAARASAELDRRASGPSFWQLLARWPAPLLPAAAAAIALLIVLTSGGGLTIPGSGEGGAAVQVILSGDPLDAVIADPVLSLIGNTPAGEITPGEVTQ